MSMFGMILFLFGCGRVLQEVEVSLRIMTPNKLLKNLKVFCCGSIHP